MLSVQTISRKDPALLLIAKGKPFLKKRRGILRDYMPNSDARSGKI
jgi:hypothetical protein